MFMPFDLRKNMFMNYLKERDVLHHKLWSDSSTGEKNAHKFASPKVWLCSSAGSSTRIVSARHRFESG